MELYLLIRIPFLWVDGMALFPFILIKDRKPTLQLITHERIHLRQQIELLIIPFYLWYVSEYLFNLIKYRNHYKSYRNISFEKEAFSNEWNSKYLKKRKFWGFLKYY